MKDLNKFRSKLQLCYYSKKLLQKIIAKNYSFNQYSDKKVDLIEIYKAIYYAKKYHANQKRQTGEPYYSHPLEVASMIIENQFNTEIIVTSILHDIIEDTKFTKKNIKSVFGSKIASQVDDVSKIKLNNLKITSQEMINLLLNEKKYNLLLIKYFDRLHNMQTIRIKSISKIKKTVQETLNLFLPLGEYLRINPSIQERLFKLCKS